MIDPLADAISSTLASYPEAVARWRANEPGAWGFLAGQGVLAYRARLGRGLTDVERRQLWASLWAALEHTPPLSPALSPTRGERESER
jgi:hypothetical protein